MKYQTVTLTIRGLSNYSQCRFTDKETSKAIDNAEVEPKHDLILRRCHINKEGWVVIPPMALHKSIVAGAKHLAESVPGKGKRGYAGYFEKGLIFSDPFVTDCRAEDVKSDMLMLDGQPGRNSGGAGTRVPKRMPYIEEGWQAKGTLIVIDETVTPAVFERTVNAAGMFIGVGRFKPEAGGFYGRYEVVNAKWE